jgi:hypothetical protein
VELRRREVHRGSQDSIAAGKIGQGPVRILKAPISRRELVAALS